MSRGRWIGVGVVRLLAVGLAVAQALAADEPAKPAAQGATQNSSAGGVRLMLLRLDAVAKDLNLTDEQKESVKKISAEAQKTWDAMHGLPRGERGPKFVDALLGVDAKVRGMLDEKQRARLQQIGQQYVRTVAPATPPRIANRLTAEQHQKWRDLSRDRAKAIGDALDRAGGDPDAARGKVTSIIDDYNERRLAVLTPEQREQFDKLLGKRIDLYEVAFPALLRQARSSAALKSESKPDATPEPK